MDEETKSTILGVLLGAAIGMYGIADEDTVVLEGPAKVGYVLGKYLRTNR